jgi:hypothetical protein
MPLPVMHGFAPNRCATPIENGGGGHGSSGRSGARKRILTQGIDALEPHGSIKNVWRHDVKPRTDEIILAFGDAGITGSCQGGDRHQHEHDNGQRTNGNDFQGDLQSIQIISSDPGQFHKKSCMAEMWLHPFAQS